MYVYHNENPDGKNVGDCTVRAISTVTGDGWEKTYLDLGKQGFFDRDMPSANRVWGEYLHTKGFTRRALPNTCPDCYTVKDFAREHPNGRFVVACDGHVVSVINGNYYDTWDSGDKTPLYYWEKER